MTRSGGRPGLRGLVFALVGLGILLGGFFIGHELRGLNGLGFAIVLVGVLTTLFGVLREFADRNH